MNISSNISSMQANQNLLNNNAHNIANVNTDRSVPNSGKTVSSENGAVKANISKATDSGSIRSQTDLAKEMSEQIGLSKSTEVNVAAIRTQDEMLGTLLDIKA